MKKVIAFLLIVGLVSCVTTRHHRHFRHHFKYGTGPRWDNMRHHG